MNQLSPEKAEQAVKLFDSFDLDEQRKILSELAKQQRQPLPTGEVSTITGKPIPPIEERASFGKMVGETATALTTPGMARALGLHREPARKAPPEEIRRMPEQERVAGGVKETFPAGRFIAGEQPQFETSTAMEVGLALPIGPSAIASGLGKIGVAAMTRDAFVNSVSRKATQRTAKEIAEHLPKIVDYLENVLEKPIEQIRTQRSPTAIGMYLPTSKKAIIGKAASIGEIIDDLKHGRLPRFISEKIQSQVLKHEAVAHVMDTWINKDNIYDIALQADSMGVRIKNLDIVLEHWNPGLYGKDYSRSLEQARKKGNTKLVEELTALQKEADLATLASESLAESAEHLTAFELRQLYNPVYEGIKGKTTTGAKANLKQLEGWHGTGAKFTAFDHSYMGSGAGSQSFGWGTYLTNERGIAEGYARGAKDQALPTLIVDGKPVSKDLFAPSDLEEINDAMHRSWVGPGKVKALIRERMIWMKSDNRQEYATHLKELENLFEDVNKRGLTFWEFKEEPAYLYKVKSHIDDADLLPWHETTPKTMIDRINKQGKKEGFPTLFEPKYIKEPMSGAEVYSYLKSVISKAKDPLHVEGITVASDRVASELLDRAGIPGIRYKAGTLTQAKVPEGAENYVIFNPKNIDIINVEERFRRMLPEDAVNEVKSLSTQLRSRLAVRNERTGEILTDDVAKSHAHLAERKGLPLDDKTTRGWMIDGKFYDSNEGAIKALHSLSMEKPRYAIQTGRGGFLSFDGIKNLLGNIRDKVTIESVPKMTRAGVQDSAIAHASAKNAIGAMSKDYLGRLSPDGIRNLTPQEMEKVAKVLQADRILGGYDQFLNMAADEEAAGHAQLAGKWRAQASRIAQKHGLSNLETTVRDGQADPAVMDAINKWKREINPDLTKMYNEELGFDPNTPREGKGRHFDTYFPLVTKDKEAAWKKFITNDDAPMPEPSASHYMNPHQKYDPFTQAAHYTGEYSTDLETIMPVVLSHRYENVTRWRLYQDLVDKGVAVWGEGIPKPDHLGGKPVVSFPAKVPDVNPNTGLSRNVFKTLYVQKELAGELNRVLNTNFAGVHSKALTVLTDLQLAQWADLITHTKNLLSVISTAQGSGAVWKDITRQIPLLGTADGVARIASVWKEVLEDSPAIRKEMAAMAKAGLLRPHFPSTGIGAVTKSQDFLYRVDSATRVTMNRFFDNLVQMGKVTDTPINRFNYVNQVGQYNKRLMGPLMQAFKEWGVAPFITAGRNFNRQARRRLFGSPGVEATSELTAAQMRLTHLAGVGMLFTLPMMLNTLTTGSPGGRSGTPLGAWDLGMAPDEKGKHKTLDLLQVTGIRRGMRSLGLEAAIEGLRQGHTPNQIMGKMATDVVSTAAHPWMGPGVSGVGHALPILNPAMGMIAYGATATDHVENFRNFLEQQNPLLYSAMRPAMQKMGIDKNPDKPYLENLAHQFFLKSPFQAFGVKDTSPAQSGAEKAAHDIISGHFHSSMDKSDKEKYSAEAAILNAMRRGKASEDEKKLAREATKKGLISDTDIDRIMKKGSVTQLEAYMERLNAKEAAKVFLAAKQTSNKRDMALILPSLQDKFDKADARIQKEVLGILGGAQ